MWTLDGHAKHYRQTIVQSCVHCPEVAATIFTKHCASKLLLSLMYIVVIATASLD